MAIILGLNTHHAGASAALLIDGQPAAAIAEERLNRIKYYAAFPKQSIQEVMRIAGIKFRDIDYVAVGRDPSVHRAKKLEYLLRNPRNIPNLLKIRSARMVLDDMRQLLIAECGANFGSARVRHGEFVLFWIITDQRKDQAI